MVPASGCALHTPSAVLRQLDDRAFRSRSRCHSAFAAARPEQAEPLLAGVVSRLEELGAVVATGRFRADMAVALVNDGPVTLIVEV